ncbi:hypothetical protein F511_32661 [Dorcoceras hygrometricum]|uniref:Uncharacterized protein n=1 Tax=Dorcoceras hygrometricum TaxID=472368 RepID=A0A2Z7CND8_9LAMI|nr:hypothetical protein F511_32661 [Dorcoceras hygrometricum]
MAQTLSQEPPEAHDLTRTRVQGHKSRQNEGPSPDSKPSGSSEQDSGYPRTPENPDPSRTQPFTRCEPEAKIRMDLRSPNRDLTCKPLIITL